MLRRDAVNGTIFLVHLGLYKQNMQNVLVCKDLHLETPP